MNEDTLTLDEFKRVCAAAGVEDDDATMAADYTIGQAVGEAIDNMCLIAEQAPGPVDVEAARTAVDDWLETPNRATALVAAAYLMKWAGEAEETNGGD